MYRKYVYIICLQSRPYCSIVCIGAIFSITMAFGIPKVMDLPICNLKFPIFLFNSFTIIAFYFKNK